MKSFAYKAYTGEGKKKTGLILAEDRAAASRALRKEGLFPEEITPQSSGVSGLGGRRLRRLDSDLQSIFARQLAVLLSAGLPVDEALSAIGSSGGAGTLDQVAMRVRALVMEGAPLSESLEQASSGFAPYIISAVRAGEASRDLAAVFETIATHLEDRRTERTALATALIYPAFVGAVSLLVCGILMVTVAPQLADMFEATGQPLPPLTAFMLGVTETVQRHWLAVIAVPVLLAVGVPLLLRRKSVRDRWHRLLLRLPVIGRLTMLDEANQYLRTLALVVGSRQPVIEGARNATDVLSIARFRRESEEVTEAIRAGAPLSQALSQTSFVPKVAQQLVEAGEKSARVAHMTERAAALVETWLNNDRKRLATLLDPALMMIIGVFVLIVVLSVLLPIFDLQAAIQL